MQTANNPNKSSAELRVKVVILKHLTPTGKSWIPECGSLLQSQGGVGTSQWSVICVTKAGQTSKGRGAGAEITAKTRSGGEQRTHQSCRGDGCAAQAENTSGAQVPLFHGRISPVCVTPESISALGEAGVTPAQRCVNQEQFDPNLVPSLCF